MITTYTVIKIENGMKVHQLKHLLNRLQPDSSLSEARFDDRTLLLEFEEELPERD